MAQIEITEPVRFLALGDSYTIGESVTQSQRWPDQFYKALGEKGYKLDSLRIIATTGWRTDQLLKASIDEDLKGFNLVSLLIGVNNQYQGIPIEDMKLDFDKLIKEAIYRAGNRKKRVFIISIPDYAFTSFGQSKSPEKISMELDEYNSWQKQRADELGIAYVNITGISREALKTNDLVANDELHPSGKQYQLWVNKILKELVN